jgi:hypothetical protein
MSRIEDTVLDNAVREFLRSKSNFEFMRNADYATLRNAYSRADDRISGISYGGVMSVHKPPEQLLSELKRLEEFVSVVGPYTCSYSCSSDFIIHSNGNYAIEVRNLLKGEKSLVSLRMSGVGSILTYEVPYSTFGTFLKRLADEYLGKITDRATPNSN